MEAMMAKTTFRTQSYGQENEADQDQAKDRGDNVVDEHRDFNSTPRRGKELGQD